jgi:paraquat-inducible protein A
MRTYPGLIACVNCDTLSERPRLARGQQAACARCGSVLLRTELNVQQLLALALSAAILFIIANIYPVIGITLNGAHHETTLLGSVLSLANFSVAPLAIVVALSIIVVPALQIALLCWLLLYARAGKRAPLFNWLMNLWEHLYPWSMVEVALLAALVSMVKLRGMLHVHVGIGLWAMAGLVVVLIATVHRDIRSLWAEIGGTEIEASPS